MPIELPPDAALREFTSATTRAIRRVEIYEEDAVTRWVKDTRSRLVNGTVTVDYDRDERRALDLVLNNSDNALINAPGELWYDKIFKVFRGVEILVQDAPPKILVIADGGDNTGIPQTFRSVMSSYGFGDIRINPLATSMADLIGYDIIVGINSTNSTRNQLMKDAYALGYPVISIGDATVATLGTDIFGSGATDESVVIEEEDSGLLVKPEGSHILATNWTSFYYKRVGTTSFPDVSSKPSDLTPIAKDDTMYTVSIKEAGQAKWIMFHGTVDAALFNIPQFKNFLLTSFNYLNPLKHLATWEVQIGEFMVDRISESSSEPTFKITGRDYVKKCQKSKFLYATQFESGQKLEKVIGDIAGAAGIVKRLLPVSDVTIGQDFLFDADVPRWDAMKEIATAYNYELYFDATGYLVMRPFRDPSTTAPTVTIAGGPDGTMVSYEKSTSDSDLYNVIIVVGESSDSSTPNVSAVAKNTDPSSPTNIYELGERVKRYSSSFITSETQAQELADSWLAIYSMESFDLNLETLVLPWLEVGDIMHWIDPNPAPDDPNMFLLSSLNIPLSLSAMSAVGKRTTIAG